MDEWNTMVTCMANDISPKCDGKDEWLIGDLVEMNGEDLEENSIDFFVFEYKRMYQFTMDIQHFPFEGKIRNLDP